MGLVTPDVLEEVLDLRRHIEVGVVRGIVRPAIDEATRSLGRLSPP